ncbi:MAG: 5'/3'-nucleotidase SurE [Anaerolineae bacterium]|nr:5'/3'-nucleotidase SurE [Anaerolineae bacterium]
MHILVTNDDGVHAPGLLALAQAMRPLGKVTVLAPDRNWSVTGHIKTMNRPLRVTKTTLADGTPALACDGAPSDCVALAHLGVLKEEIDLVVSGINPTVNVGYDLTYSGTVTSAMEAAIWGIRGIAFSQESSNDRSVTVSYNTTRQVATEVVSRFLEHDLPAHLLLNVNVPLRPYAELRGYQVTRQGERIYHDRVEEAPCEDGATCYRITGKFPTGVPHPGTDIGALAEGYVSIMPVLLDLTDANWLEPLQKIDWAADGKQPAAGQP